ncbi:sulfite exporter TauE/SafE family protein [Paenibacillus senegalensis]|uniref:sulfite exporter TauE/SafE family protein n=1 Tax=Paenibacillus senegalensis TaxID=1465766 RepID=UPI000289315C
MFITLLLLVLIGVVSATFGSIVGLGGGVIIVPSLIYLGPLLLDREITTATAVGTSMAVLILTALSSSYTYYKLKRIDFRSAWLFFITSGPAAILGASLTGNFEQGTFQLVFGSFMLFMAMLMIARDYMKPIEIKWKINREFTDAMGITHSYGYNITSALILGLGVGLISGLFGIGGGSLFVPAMVLLFRYPPHIAAATSMFVILLSSILGTGSHMVFGDIDWLSAAALAPGALIGGWLGAKIATRMSGKGLLWLLRLTLLALAIRMIWAGLG